jgi:hypothetical protein
MSQFAGKPTFGFLQRIWFGKFQYVIAFRALEVLRFMTITAGGNPSEHHSRFALGTIKAIHRARNGTTTLEHVTHSP